VYPKSLIPNIRLVLGYGELLNPKLAGFSLLGSGFHACAVTPIKHNGTMALPANLQLTIPTSTQRDITDSLIADRVNWSGRLDESGFLGRIWDLSTMPSTDGRFLDADGDNAFLGARGYAFARPQKPAPVADLRSARVQVRRQRASSGGGATVG